MVYGHGQFRAEQAKVAKAHQIAADFAGGFRAGLSRPVALAELAALDVDPDQLSEAAARHATADNWYAITAVDLLLEAGAEQLLIERHISDEWLALDPASCGPSHGPQRRAS